MAPEPATESIPSPPLPPRGGVQAVLVGNPNTGKTTLFNQLCGARAKTSNFPGTTTALRTGTLRLPEAQRRGARHAGHLRPDARHARSRHRPQRDERGPPASATPVIVIVDAANLARNLVLVGQLLAAHARLIVCLNMMDVAARRGLTVDADALGARLGVPVVPMVASRGDGVDALRRRIGRDGRAARASVAPSPRRAAAGRAASRAERLGARVAAAVVTVAPPGHDAARRGFTERLDRVADASGRPAWPCSCS